MKRKNWKRTAAFVTSMTMATTMLPAELGSVLVKAVEDPNKAPETGVLNWKQTKFTENSVKKSFITELKVGTTIATNVISNQEMEVTAGDKVQITSIVPLNITYFNYDNNSKTKNDSDGENTFELDCTDYGVNYHDSKYYVKKEDTSDGDELDAATAKAKVLIAAGYDVADETFTAAWNGGTLKVTFKAKETKNSDGTYTYSFTMPDDNDTATAYDFVNVDVFKKAIKVNFYESEDERTKDYQPGGNGNYLWTSKVTGGEAGKECREYFGPTTTGNGTDGLKITSSNPDPIVDNYNGGLVGLSHGTDAPDGIIGNDDDEAKVIIGDTVTITAEKPFIVFVNDRKDSNSWINATKSYDQKTNRYKAEFKMPELAEGATEAIVDIVKIEEAYSYTPSGNKLIANSTNTDAIRNVEAAGIVAKYYDSEADAKSGTKGFGTAGDIGKEITGAVPNGKYVVVKATRATKLTGVDATGAFSVSKNGTVIDDDTIVIKADGNNTYYCAGAAGSYQVDYTVAGKNGSTYKLSYAFSVAAKDELTAENVTLNISAKKDNGAASAAIINAVMDQDEQTKTGLEDGKVVNFMLKKYVNDDEITKTKAEDEVNKSSYQFTVDPTVIAEGVNLTAGQYNVTGSPSGSSLNTTYEFTINITDPEYGGSVQNPKKINIKWRVVGYDEIPHWNNNRFGVNGAEPVTGSGTNGDASISIDMMGENSIGLKEEIFKAAGANGAAYDKLEDGEVDFQYIKAPGADRTNEVQDELDEWKTGLPSEIGDYTVYVVYDGVVQATVDVHITKYSLGIYADASDLTYKYGHKFDLEKPFVQKNTDGETVEIEIAKDDLKCTVYNAVAERDNKGNIIGWVMPEGAQLALNRIVNNKPITDVGQLNAGHYFIEFNADIDNEDYSVSPVAQPLTVNKKPLDDPSLVILIDPFNYDGATHDVVKERAVNFTVRDTDFDETDSRYDVSDIFKITEGGKQKDVKTYDCSFKLVNENTVNLDSKIAEADRLLALVYNGTNIKNVDKTVAVNVAEAVADLASDLADDFAEAEKWATRTQDGHLSCVTRAKNDIMASATLAKGKVETARLANLNAGSTSVSDDATTAAKDAAKDLVDKLSFAKNNQEGGQVDSHAKHAYNSFKNEPLSNYEGSAMAGKWHIVAPEADPAKVKAGLAWTDSKTTLYDNGKIHLEITRNADDKINTDKSVAKIAKFGVIVDKEGKLEAPANYGVKYTDAGITAISIKDATGTVDADATAAAKAAARTEKATAEKFLTFGNGFLEGGYTETSSPVTCASQTYKVNIKVKDAETGIWARPYIQYEDGTVSYGDVKYVSLTDEAVERLELWTAGVETDVTKAPGKAVRKADLNDYQTATAELIQKNVKSGYNTAENKFYVYTRYVDLQKAGFTNVAEVADFGIVADRDGEFNAAIAEAEDAAYKKAYQTAYNEAKQTGKSDADAATYATPIAEAAKAAAPKAYMKKNLKKDTAKVVGHYNKNNTVLGVNEYAASVNLGNSDTGLWVRSYIDLGNGLVIYNNPIYIKSASEYYGSACAGTLETNWEKKDDNEYSRLVFTHKEAADPAAPVGGADTRRKAQFAAKAGVDVKNVEVVNTGVVADKNNILDRSNKMVLNSAFIDGVHKGKLTDAYSAKLTPKGTNDVSVRTYTTYKIKGGNKDVEVTVYGPVKTFKYNEKITVARVQLDITANGGNGDDIPKSNEASYEWPEA